MRNHLHFNYICPMSSTAKIIWLTGLSGSGKSTLADALKKALEKKGETVIQLDGDLLREGLNSDLGFSPEDRRENIRRTREVAKLMHRAGLTVVAAMISPYRADRDKLRAELPKHAFIEVFVDCPLDVCEQRDVKGLYKQARRGEINNFTGIDAPYEAPLNPEVHIQTHRMTIEEAVNVLLQTIENTNNVH